ncbi:MAG TPA: hypothetical protein PK079_02545 [Leptospiraceae bacterium]|nr:hypothetical protein [Leptospiraceae bacterium]HMW04084.1 hypothetical protein [Leptospiraceae bacterium]HMX30849.1 hypothetical protein [Leptospiraceae bacterium]HMY30078.1 hypothetical protein [Leptospiraceae bacterium]HMZ62735.1 hypothetical protein [Leptospiraceae bacterium]
MKYSLLLSIFILFLNSCIDKENAANDLKDSNQTNKFNLSEKRLEQSNGGSPYFSGIATHPLIEVKEGRIKIILENGYLTLGSKEKVQLVGNENTIQAAVSLVEANNYNSQIEGYIEDVNKNEIIFVPSVSLKHTSVYKMNIRDEKNKKEYSEIIYIAAANYCDSNSYFSKIPLQQLPKGSEKKIDLSIKENSFKDKEQGQISALAWDHKTSNNFYFSITNQTQGAKYKILAVYGVYNIPGHECELYLQRETSDLYLTWTDSNYASKVTKITHEDTAIRNYSTQNFYGFSKTYILVKVVSSDNLNITAQDNGILSLQQTDSSYELPVSSNIEEESSLLAYLNKGNNNNYSMVLGGLIVGIFGFFLSRKLIRKEDNSDLD